ncbi:MAG: universal stress protein [Salinisphaera sp.]|uniref:universal stress protein n=1 Tax=Salinisphaera sp. TaxID=1914330 RepID=UPI003C7B96E1
MPHKILLPIDLEHENDLDNVFACAIEQASMHDSTFVLLSVLPQLSLGYFPSIERRYMHKITGEAQRHLDRVAEQRLGTRFAWSAHVLTGSPGRMIVHAADEHEVDLIVMASHNPRRMDVLLGSVADWVVRHARHSILVVRELS